jgi:hypothetical protein
MELEKTPPVKKYLTDEYSKTSYTFLHLIFDIPIFHLSNIPSSIFEFFNL